MAGTTWKAYPRTTNLRWLLANGEVVTAPDLEVSGAGRRVRVAGTNISAFHHEIDEVIGRGVAALAAARDTSVWMALGEQSGERTCGQRLDREEPSLHLVHRRRTGRTSTTCWWRFRHPSLPIEALLEATMAEHGWSPAHRDSVRTQNVTVRLHFPSTYPRHWETAHHKVAYDASFSAYPNALGVHEHEHILREFVRDNPPAFAATLPLGEQASGAAPRTALLALLKAVHAAEDLDAIEIPDLSDPDHPAWLRLDLHETNVTSALLAEMSEYVNGGASVDQAAEHYQQMIDVLRRIGKVLEARSENDFLAALLAGDVEALTIPIGQPAESGEQVDRDHTLTVHLATGTFVVTCTHTAQVSRDEIATKWDEAQAIATLTGQADELLAYARRYAETANTRRTAQILTEREAPTSIRERS